MARRPASRNKRRRTPPARRGFPWLRLGIVLLVLAVGYVLWLNVKVQVQFAGKRWALPARVFARPLDLYTGLQLPPQALAQELAALHYRSVSRPDQPGEMARAGDSFRFVTRPFIYPDGSEPAQAVAVSFAGGQVTSLTDTGGRALPLVRLEPEQIGAIYPNHNEDRILVRLKDVPPLLTRTLIAVEDRHFYTNFGIEPRAIARALWANLRAGHTVQGGSTLTQQLVKNFFLSNQRTLSRKINEAIMALLVEYHYSKDDILEAYLNEVYLGQDGPRAIHGFGLASEFYFERPIGDLSLDQIALLVGLVKGPSYYDPRLHPARALQRRNLVLSILVGQGVISAAEAQRASARPLGVLPKRPSAINAYPDFMDLVRRQLHRDYKEEDLRSEGLRIFTTLDPWVQETLERTMAEKTAALERRQHLPKDSLEGAAIVTTTQDGEVLALAGGRDPGFAGFNRALDARRQVGSLVKPAVYLTALEQPSRYTLATLLDDSPLTYTAKDGQVWTPRNFDRTFGPPVPAYLALAHSMNVPTARLGLDVGVDAVIGTLRKLGVTGDLTPYPSLFLGATGLSPLEVAQMYQTLANGGFRTPLRAIRAVLSRDGTPLQSYPLTVDQAFKSGPVYLVDTAMQHVVSEGTAAGLSHYLPADIHAAGKTGTTDDLRDSWFAGFTGDRLAVVWLGRDDNQPTGLTGASGALQVWGSLMSRIGAQPLKLSGGENLVWAWIDPHSGLLAGDGCSDRVQLPFLPGSAPTKDAPCAGGGSAPLNWLRRLFR